MSRIRVDELINQGNSGPTLAVEGLRVPSTKSLVVEGIISLNGDTGLTGQVLSRTTTGVGWTNVPLTDNNTTYTLSTVDGANPATDKVIRLSAGGSGSGFTDVVLVAGNNVSLTRNSGRIIIDSSFTDTNTVTRIGAAGQNYTDGDINLVGTGAAQITQSGRTFTINVNDENTTYVGESGVTVTADNKIKIGQPVGPTDPVTFQQVTVSGNLIVQGTTTTSNSVTVTTLDKFINLNDVLIPTDAVADGGGIRLKGDSDHTILWSNVDDSWTSSEHFNLASGRNYMIDGDEVITSTSLGNGVRQSTLESVGILSAGRWEAQTIGIPYGGTGHTNANDALNAFLPVQAANSGKYLTTDGQDTSWAAIPPTYNGWSIGDNSVTAQVNSNDIVRVIGTGSALVTMDNVQKRLTINADNTTYNLTVENQQQPNRKSIRLTDNTGYAEEVILSAGTGVTLTRTNNRLEFSVAQDLSTSAVPTFTALNITGGVNATTYTGSGAQLEGLTGVPNGVYGSSAVIPVISVDPSGRITNISTAPNTGAAGAGGIVAGGNDYSIQYNNNGGFAGSDKIKFEPIQGELTLRGYLVSDNIVSTGATITELQALDYIKFPSKNTSERDYLNVLNGSVVYNNDDDQLQMYQDGQWLPVGGIRNIGDLLDVDLSTPAGDGQILSYSASGGRWVPTTITASGSVQQNNSLFVQNNTTPLGSGNLDFNSATNVLTYTPPDITNFITTEVDPLFTASPASGILLSHITNWTQAYNWGDHSSVGYLQATNTEKANWNEAHSWGNHASAGYLTAEVDTLDSVTGRGATTINNITVGQLTAGGLTYPNANGTIGQVLTSDGAGNVTWQNAATGSGGSGAQQLDQLTDVSLTTPTSGQVLYFNGTNWTNGASSGGSGSTTFLGLTDTPASMGSAGQVLAVNSGGTALEFISAATGGANVTISDNPPTNPNSGDLWWESDAGRLKIRYSNVWVDANPAGGTSGSGGAYADGDVDSHLNRGTATIGQVLSWNGTDYAWVAQTDTDTTYTAGTGISLVGTQFSLDSSSSPTFAGLTLNGNASLNGHVLPYTDGTFDLGSTTKNWRRLYVDNLVAGGLTYPTTNGTSGQVLTSNGLGVVSWTTISGSGGSGGSLTIQDEGVNSNQNATTINFVGAGVTVTGDGSSTKTITIPGGGGGASGSSVYQSIGLESWTGTHAAPILFTQALNDPTGGGNQASWLQGYVSDVQAISANAAVTLTTIAGPANTSLSHAAFTSDGTLQNAIRSALSSNAGVNAIANAQFTIVPTDGETHTIDGTSYPVMGKLYVPTGLAASSIDVVVVFHGTVSSGTIQAASETALTQFLDVNGVNARDKIIFSAAYPQDHISQSDQYNLTGVGTEQADFLMGDNLPYARAAVGWVKNSLNAYITAQGGSKTINDVYLFGHSQGGKLVTKMNTLETGIAGVIANAPGPIQFDRTCSADPGNTSCSKVAAIHGPSFVDTLDTVTDAGAVTTNTITVGGARAATLKLNTNTVATDYGNVSGTIGDIKRINEHPHYYDGTTWRPFYLAGTSLSASTSDVNYDDVQVRLTGTTNAHSSGYIYNHVNDGYFATASGASVVSSPSKFGSNAIQFDGTALGYCRTTSENPAVPIGTATWSDNTYSTTAKRGGFPDFSGNWTFEAWVSFDDLSGSTLDRHGIMCRTKMTGAGAGLGVGLSLIKDSGSMNWLLGWYNGTTLTTDGVHVPFQAFHDYGAFNWQEDTWYHIAVSRRSSDGRLFCHINGTFVAPSAAANGQYFDTDLNQTVNVAGEYEFRLGNNRTNKAVFASSTYQREHYLLGAIDDVRWTDYCRYDTTSFSVPTQAYPITSDAPPTVDPDWSNVKLRLPFDTDLNDVGPNALDYAISSATYIERVTNPVKYGTGAFRSSSIAHYMRVNDPNSTLRFDSTWTVEFWANFNTLPSTTGYSNTIWNTTSDNLDSHDVGFAINSYAPSSNLVDFYWRSGTTETTFNFDKVLSTELIGSWNHFALVKDSNADIHLYLNGYRLRYNAADDAFVNDTSISTSLPADQEFRIGHADDDLNASEGGFDGIIDDFRITSTVKYTDNFTPPSGPLPTTGSASPNPPGTPTGGGLTYPTTNGTNGQLLTSDGNGNVTWTLGENSDLSVNSLTSATGVTIPNGQTLKLGTGSVFVASTDVGTNFTDFLPTGGQDVRHYCDSSNQGIVLKNGGSVELYHNNTKKLETTASGIEVAGTGAFTGPVFIDNYAATAFVITDTNTNEMFVVDSVAGKLQVGSSAGGASGIYLKHNNFGALNAVELDGATGNIVAKGSLTAGGLTYPTTNGSSGDVLTSDGAGNVTWVAGSNPGPTTVEESIVGTITFTANGFTSYSFTGTGYPTSTAQTTNLRIHAGLKYKIINTAGTNHPLEFRSGGVVHPGYAAGWITGSKTGTQYITVPYSEVTGTNASTTFQYVCTLHPTNMNGNVEVAFF